MTEAFWLKKWEKNEIGFHKSDVNPIITTHFTKLALPPKSRILIPLCGKTLDIAWLLERGYQVTGSELSEKAIGQLFEELNLIPVTNIQSNFTRYHCGNLTVFVGNIFNLSRPDIGSIEAIYDRAALIALNRDDRKKYTRHLMNLTDIAPQLLVSFEFRDESGSGPPFNVTENEVELQYGDFYSIELLETISVPPRGNRTYPAREKIWRLLPLP